jgi:hypothetical protein
MVLMNLHGDLVSTVSISLMRLMRRHSSVFSEKVNMMIRALGNLVRKARMRGPAIMMLPIPKNFRRRILFTAGGSTIFARKNRPMHL